MNKNIPYLSLDDNYNIINTYNDIDVLYPFITGTGFFRRLFRNNGISDFSRPVLCDTFPLSGSGLKLLVSKEGESINCYAVEQSVNHQRMNNIGYQMREPIASIFALLPIIVDNVNSYNPERAITHIEEVFSCTYKLLRNVTNLSIAEKISNNSRGRLAPVNFSSLLESLCNSVKTVVKNITVDLEAEDNIIINANKNLLTNGVLNMISNSLNYRSDEDVKISIKLTSGERNAVFTYRDNSKGIKEEYTQDVFKPFFTQDPYGDVGFENGLGLGLHIANTAFKQAGGNLLLTSSFGEGVKYTVSLPLCFDSDMILESHTADFLLNKYSEVFVQLCDVCTLPDIR